MKESVETVELKLCRSSSVITCSIVYYDEACSRKVKEVEGTTLCNKFFYT